MISNNELFLQAEPKVNIKSNKEIRVEDLVSVFSSDDKFQNKIKKLVIGKTEKEDKNKVIPMIYIIKKIKEVKEDIDIVAFGSPEILIEIENEKKEIKVLKFLKITLVSLILFLGAGIAIINFHVDVDMEKSLGIISYVVVGERDVEPIYLKIPYSLGLGVGMVTFFNRVLKKKKNKQPSPLELEMHSYENSIDDYIIDITKHNEKEN
ncbi:stage V sporulation protein AA [Clostridium sp. D2Q-14]|uniref:stage V sporulation protein AA n=1 Tax=Anaeromonas gelatinilytica TaxID=2683194 RepID=UPI00193C4014|nr:stage V sporulation protein AA [Anaeromonas gelatinilytica]